MGAMVPAGGSIRVAPLVSVTRICSSDVSKASDSQLRHPVPGEIWYSRVSSLMTQARLPWLTATALGSPVDPEVWMA